MKYLRLLRFQDQYLQFVCAVASGIYLQIKDWWILYWAIALTFLSFTAAIINELTDSKDCDKFSWNKSHINSTNSNLTKTEIWSMFLIFSVIGLYLSFTVRLFLWGLIFYLIGLAYSLKPIRLKSRFVFDIVAQLSAWFVIPFLAPISLLGKTSDTLPFLIVMLLLVWSIFYPYQLADFKADFIAGIKPTHIVLGMEKSLILGLLLGMIGVFLYLKLNIFQNNPWSIVIALLAAIAIIFYLKWLKMKSLDNQVHSMQFYVGQVKPLTQLLVPYLLVWYFI